MLETDVLVVGGSLVGLSASVFLANHGVECHTVERHAGTSIHPRARAYTARTMELYRSVGLAEDIEETGTLDESLGVMMTSPGSLADGDWVTW